MKEMVDRRRFMRFDTALGASYEVLDGKTGGSSEIRNLSREGINMLIDRGLDKGTEVKLYMNVPGDNVPIFAGAQVAWNKRVVVRRKNVFSTGLRFTKIDNFDKARLLDYVYSQWLKMLKQK